MFFKILTTFFVLVIFAIVFEVWRTGRSLRVSRTKSGSYDAALLAHHRGLLAGLGCITTLMILLIEMQMTHVASHAALYAAGGVLFYFHLLSDALLVVITTVIIVRFTGKRNRVWHGRLVYPAIALFFITTATGLYLLFFRLP